MKVIPRNKIYSRSLRAIVIGYTGNFRDIPFSLEVWKVHRHPSKTGTPWAWGFCGWDLIFVTIHIATWSLLHSSVQSLSRVQLFATPWIAACQASLSITNSQSSLRLTSIESVMPSSHLILCRPLLLLPLIPPSIRVFSNESILCMKWLKY